MKMRQILAPTDFSACSKQAIACAYEWAQTFGARLALLHVLDDLPSYIGFLPPGGAAAILEDLERQACFDLTQLLPQAEDAKVKVIAQVVTGTPYLKIIEIAQSEKADLIVIATHGRTGLSHLVMGSVAERIVRLAPCPVLTIPSTAATD
jgi:nucleotide-binding universal stress UspA family protein